MAEAGGARWLVVRGLAVLLLVALACVAVRESPAVGPREMLGTAFAKKARPAKHKLSFAKWYEEQSAAAWFGDDTMHKQVQVGHQEFKEKENKAKWLTKQDMKGIPVVLQAEHAKREKHEAVELAMMRLAAKSKARGLAKALKQQLAGYGNIAELNKLVKKPAEERAAKPARLARTQAHTQKLFQLSKSLRAGSELTQSLEDVGEQKIYKPMITEGDGPTLPEDKILGIVERLDTNFLNRTTSSFAANKKHLKGMTPAEVAKENSEKAARRQEEAKTEAVMASAAPTLQDMLNKQMQLKVEQEQKLKQLSTTLDDVLNPQGYKDAVINQCGDHCVEVQIAANHQAEILKQQQEAEKKEQDHELSAGLNTPIVSRDSQRR